MATAAGRLSPCRAALPHHDPGLWFFPVALPLALPGPGRGSNRCVISPGSCWLPGYPLHASGRQTDHQADVGFCSLRGFRRGVRVDVCRRVAVATPDAGGLVWTCFAPHAGTTSRLGPVVRRQLQLVRVSQRQSVRQACLSEPQPGRRSSQALPAPGLVSSAGVAFTGLQPSARLPPPVLAWGAGMGAAQLGGGVYGCRRPMASVSQGLPSAPFSAVAVATPDRNGIGTA